MKYKAKREKENASKVFEIIASEKEQIRKRKHKKRYGSLESLYS